MNDSNRSGLSTSTIGPLRAIPVPTALPRAVSWSGSRRSFAKRGGSASISASASGGRAIRAIELRSPPAVSTASRASAASSSGTSPNSISATFWPARRPASSGVRTCSLKRSLAVELGLQVVRPVLGVAQVGAEARLELLRGARDDVVGEPDADQDPDRERDEDGCQRGSVVATAIAHARPRLAGGPAARGQPSDPGRQAPTASLILIQSSWNTLSSPGEAITTTTISRTNATTNRPTPNPPMPGR